MARLTGEREHAQHYSAGRHQLLHVSLDELHDRRVRRKLSPISSFVDLALFVSFFPPLVAGPIVRAVYFLPQLASAKNSPMSMCAAR